MSKVSYIAYIDESGDDGIRRVKPNYPNGSSEWFVIGCYLIKAENNQKTSLELQKTISKFKNHQSKSIHFRDLIPIKKEIVCRAIAGLPCRGFVVMSNKRNIEKYENRKLPPNKWWLYWFLVRLLLERVTKVCASVAAKNGTPDAKLRIVFSRRGGASYEYFKNYLADLGSQSASKNLFLPQGDLDWSVIDFDEIDAIDHPNSAGLQFADTIAGAFFKAVEHNSKGECDHEFAKILKPIMACMKNESHLGFGVKTMPWVSKIPLSIPQKEIFLHYGYKEKR